MTRRVTTITATVIQASGGACFYCGATAKHAEHVVPKCQGGTDALENLVPACASCNARKGKTRLPPDAESRALEYAANRAAWIRETGFEGCAGYMLRIPMTADDWAMLDDLLRREDKIVSKAELIRRLIQRAHEGQNDSAASLLRDAYWKLAGFMGGAHASRAVDKLRERIRAYVGDIEEVDAR